MKRARMQSLREIYTELVKLPMITKQSMKKMANEETDLVAMANLFSLSLFNFVVGMCKLISGLWYLSLSLGQYFIINKSFSCHLPVNIHCF